MAERKIDGRIIPQAVLALAVAAAACTPETPKPIITTPSSKPTVELLPPATPTPLRWTIEAMQRSMNNVRRLISNPDLYQWRTSLSDDIRVNITDYDLETVTGFINVAEGLRIRTVPSVLDKYNIIRAEQAGKELFWRRMVTLSGAVEEKWAIVEEHEGFSSEFTYPLFMALYSQGEQLVYVWEEPKNPQVWQWDKDRAQRLD